MFFLVVGGYDVVCGASRSIHPHILCSVHTLRCVVSVGEQFAQAPVPFLVGIHSRYLAETRSDRRPEGVVFVDLDNDSIYLGLDEDM